MHAAGANTSISRTCNINQNNNDGHRKIKIERRKTKRHQLPTLSHHDSRKINWCHNIKDHKGACIRQGREACLPMDTHDVKDVISTYNIKQTCLTNLLLTIMPAGTKNAKTLMSIK